MINTIPQSQRPEVRSTIRGEEGVCVCGSTKVLRLIHILIFNIHSPFMGQAQSSHVRVLLGELSLAGKEDKREREVKEGDSG